MARAPFKESLRRLAANEPAPQASIEHVSDTALLVAACRAMETELEDGFVRDPFAARLAGERGPALAHEVDASKWLAFGIGIRSRFIDDLLLDLVRRGEIDTVVNMGAGLDTRPWRLDLPESLLWIEVDFPDILAYKEEKLEGARPKCRHQTLTADLTDPEQRRRVLESSAGTRALLMTEGLLTYLPGETVRALAGDAHGYRYWLLDVISNWMMSALPGRNWAPFDRVRSKTRLSGDEILEAAKKAGWNVETKLRNIVEGFQLGHARLMRMVQESAARGETRRESPPADDVSGVWLFSRE